MQYCVSVLFYIVCQVVVATINIVVTTVGIIVVITVGIIAVVTIGIIVAGIIDQ